MEEKELAYWVALQQVPGIGAVTFRQLVELFGSPKGAWQASKKELEEKGTGQKVLSELLAFREIVDPSELLQSILSSQISLITLIDPNYPRLLKEIYDPPPVLYVKGEILPQDEKAIAVVGSRKMTSYGKTVTEKLTAELSTQGFTIISGLAFGVDGCAHQAALDAGGRTIAVLGGGLWHVYPERHQKMAEKIWQGNGAVISEFPPDLPALPGNFPARNRIISGLSLGVLVTEAAEKSGTMITVADALEQNREVFAVPGPITSALSAGTMQLLKQGAKVVTQVEDILEELNIEGNTQQVTGNKKIITPDNKEEAMILKLLENEPKHIDDIVRQSGMSSSETLSTLSLMELAGKVVQVEQGVWAVAT